jgi:hypothetical protein
MPTCRLVSLRTHTHAPPPPPPPPPPLEKKKGRHPSRTREIPALAEQVNALTQVLTRLSTHATMRTVTAFSGTLSEAVKVDNTTSSANEGASAEIVVPSPAPESESGSALESASALAASPAQHQHQRHVRISKDVPVVSLVELQHSPRFIPLKRPGLTLTNVSYCQLRFVQSYYTQQLSARCSPALLCSLGMSMSYQPMRMV